MNKAVKAEIIDNPPKSIKSLEQPQKHAPKTRMQAKIRRQSLIKGLLAGKDIKEIAQTLDLSPKTAVTQCTQMLSEPAVQRSFIRILDQQGLTDEHLAKKAHELLEAQTPHFFTFEGKVSDKRFTPANETQRKTLELIARFKGHLKDSATSTDPTIMLMSVVVNQINTPKD